MSHTNESLFFKRHTFTLAISAFLASFCALCGEMILTRLLAYKLWTHVVHLIICIALLGYGIGATLQMVLSKKKLFSEKNLNQGIGWLLLAQISCFLVAAYAISLLDPSYLAESLTGHVLLSYLIVIIPFILSGYLLTLLFQQAKPESYGLIYFADLLGAGSGVLFFFPMIGLCGPFGTLYLFGGALVLIVGQTLLSGQRLLIGTALFLLVGGNYLLPESSLDIRLERFKELEMARRAMPQQHKKTFEAWHPLGKVEVVSPTNLTAAESFAGIYPGTFMVPLQPIPNFHYFTMNGAAGTPAYEYASMGPGSQTKVRLFSTPMEFPYLLMNPPNALVIGAGGGRDVFSSLAHGAKSVLGAEINPAICNEMKFGALAKKTGHLYHQPGVAIHCFDGRKLVKMQQNKNTKNIGLITLNGIDTFTAVSNGAYTFSESYLYTQEAIEDYLSLLAPTGLLNLNRWHFKDYPKEALRLIIQSTRALAKQGATDPSKHIFYAVYDMWGMLLVKKTPFTPQEQKKLTEYLSNFEVRVEYQPYQWAQSNVFSEYFQARKKGTEEQFIASAPFDVKPVTDDRPFFFKYYKLSQIPEVLTTALYTDSTPLGGYKALYVQVMVLLNSLLFLAAFILIPRLFIGEKLDIRHKQSRNLILYFGSIGVAYMFVQIPLIQKASLVLGSPIYSLGLVMATMLISTGIGSFLSTYKAGTNHQLSFERLSTAGLFLGSLLSGLCLGSTAIFNYLVGQAPILGGLILIVLCALLGFPMGFYFPIGLIWWKKHQADYVPWAFAINGAFTVLSVMLATLLAQVVGFRVLWLCALVLYGCAWVTLWLAQGTQPIRLKTFVPKWNPLNANT